MNTCLILLAGATLFPAQTPAKEAFLPPLVRVSGGAAATPGDSHHVADNPVLLISAEDAAELAPSPPPAPPLDVPDDAAHQLPVPAPAPVSASASAQAQTVTAAPIYEMSPPAQFSSSGCQVCQPAWSQCGGCAHGQRHGEFFGSCLLSGWNRSTERCGPCGECGCAEDGIDDDRFGCCGCESTCDLFPHFAYFPEHHGYYYFRPYNWQHVLEHQELIVGMGGDPKAPYATSMFDALYVDANFGPYEEPGVDWNQTLPRTTPRLPDLQEMLRQSK